MKRIVDIFTKDWTSELVWSYIITSENAPTSKTIDAIERDALQLAIEENRGTAETIFAKVRE